MKPNRKPRPFANWSPPTWSPSPELSAYQPPASPASALPNTGNPNTPVLGTATPHTGGIKPPHPTLSTGNGNGPIAQTPPIYFPQNDTSGGVGGTQTPPTWYPPIFQPSGSGGTQTPPIYIPPMSPTHGGVGGTQTPPSNGTPPTRKPRRVPPPR